MKVSMNEDLLQGLEWYYSGDNPDITALISEIRRLRTALEFYADEDNYFAKFDPNKECPVMWDDGATARRALGREP